MKSILSIPIRGVFEPKASEGPVIFTADGEEEQGCLEARSADLSLYVRHAQKDIYLPIPSAQLHVGPLLNSQSRETRPPCPSIIIWLRRSRAACSFIRPLI
ncbi:Hypothetical predicted protein [Xyrichtys novacula]|uniref:Uncharacterized protein n=1 Tax=Xyrichtys novacula TaxID=13765 RepID=A0AAV1EN87_XYRNO|nr:Hypothetical predicted protein [Xyrichtys novacula]